MKNKSIIALAIIAIAFTVSCGQSSSTLSTATDSTEVITDSVTVALDSLEVTQ